MASHILSLHGGAGDAPVWLEESTVDSTAMYSAYTTYLRRLREKQKVLESLMSIDALDKSDTRLSETKDEIKLMEGLFLVRHKPYPGGAESGVDPDGMLKSPSRDAMI
jgi:hypothetical protein